MGEDPLNDGRVVDRGYELHPSWYVRVVARVVELQPMGFGWVAHNATAIFQAGARSVDAMIDALAALHAKIRGEVG
jgi:hypothetical protein